MLISRSSPLTSFVQIFQLKQRPCPVLPKALDSIAPAQASSKQTIFPLAYWEKNGFSIFVRFDLSRGVIADAYQQEHRFNRPVHLDLSFCMTGGSLSEATLLQAQKTLASAYIDVHTDQTGMYIKPRIGLRGGMPVTQVMVSPQDVAISYPKSLSEIKSTRALGAQLRHLEPKDTSYSNLKTHALTCINAFSSGDMRPKDVSELSELARAPDKEIIQGVLTAFLRPLEAKTLLDPILLKGLARALEYADPKHLQPADLIAILGYLKSRIERLSVADEKSLIHELSALSSVLDAMVASDIQGLSRDKIHKSLNATLSSLEGNSHPEISALAKHALQALVRIPSDESKVHRYFRRALHIGEGVSLLAQAYGEKSVGAGAKALGEFYKGFKPDKSKHKWYEALVYIQFLIRHGAYKQAAQILLEQTKSGGLLSFIKSNGHEQVFHILVAQQIYGLSDREQAKAIPAFSDLPRITEAIRLPIAGTALITKAQASLFWQLELLKERRTILNPEEKLYTPLDGATSPHPTAARLDLDQATKDFLASDKKVFLLQGGSGAGKSMLLRKVEKQLWEACKTKVDPLPIHIRLGGIDTANPNFVEDELIKMGFSFEQIEELKTSRPVVFLLDGYDEMRGGKLINLYERGNLHLWSQCKVIIGCRTQHLARTGSPDRHFAPFKGDSPDLSALAKYYVVPFSSDQIKSYLDKYTAEHPVTGWDTERFVTTISQIKGLQALIESPFVLRMTAEVLPTIVTDKSVLTDMTLTRRNLYDAFVGKWFNRQREKLDSLPEGITDFSADCLDYCQDLAVKMVEEGLVEVHYDTSANLFGQQDSKWDGFFGMDPITTLLRQGSPLVATASGFTFIHKSILEHFASQAASTKLLALASSSTPKLSRRATLKKKWSKAKRAQNARYTTLDIANTHVLSQRLCQQELTPNEKEALEQLAIDTLRAFESSSKTSAQIQEVVPLASLPNQALVRRVLEALINPIQTDVLTSLPLVQGLASAVARINPESIDSSSLLTCLDVLQGKLASLHRAQAAEALFFELDALARLVDALLDAGVVADSIKVRGFLEQLDGLSSDHPQIKAQREYLKEGLRRLETNENRLSTWLRRAGHVAMGISCIVEAAGTYSPMKVVEGLKAFREAAKDVRNKIKHSWYDEVRIAGLLIRSGDIEAYRALEFQPEKKRAYTSLIHAMDRQIRRAVTDELRADWIAEMGALVAFADEPVQLVARGFIKNYNTFDDSAVQRACEDLLEMLPTPPSDAKPTVANPLPLPRLDNQLLTEAKQSLGWRLAQLGAKAINHPSVRQERSFHVPLNLAYHKTARVEDHFPLDQGIKEFLGEDRRVLLLLGNSGSGKSLSMRLLTAELWKEFEKGGLIPLFISLTGVSRNSKTIIEDHLKKEGFNEAQIAELKASRSFILILDGYDEMNGSEKTNLVNTNALLDWKGKVIITCRTQYAEQMGHYNPIFTPKGGQKSEMTTVAFQHDQIEKYLIQFVQNSDVTWTPEIYLRYIDRIPHVRQMIETPFTLRLLAEVLPGIVEKRGAEDAEALKLTRADFYEAFLRGWFERQLDKLIRGGHGNLCAQEAKAYYTYAVRLATLMHAEGITQVCYRPPRRGGKDTSPYAPFFGSDDAKLVRARVACPLVVEREGKEIRYSFLHKSLLEYLGGRSSFDSEALSSEGLSEALDESIEPASTSLKEAGITNMEETLLGRRLFTEDMGTLRFWVDDAKQKPQFKERLLQIVELSKTDPKVAVAAANAMTILVGAEHSFAKADLRGIRVPGALLDRGHFASADLRGADLRGCSLREVCLINVNCQEAQLQESDWGRLSALEGHKGEVTALAYSPDSSCLASASTDNTVRVWDTNLGGEELLTLQGHTSRINAVAYSPDGLRIVSASFDKTVRVWDGIYQGASLSSDKTIPFSIRGRDPLFTFEGHTSSVNDVIYNPDGSRIASRSDDKTIRIWDAIHGGKPLFTFKTSRIESIAYSPDGSRIVGGCFEAVKVWDAIHGGDPLLTLGEHTGSVMAVTYNRDGSRIASSDLDVVRVWDAVHGGKALITLNAANGIKSLLYSPDGVRMASERYDGTVQIWDAIHGGGCLLTLEGYGKAINYSSDGLRIAGVDCKTVKVWDAIHGGEPLATFEGHEERVLTVAYSPDGASIASAGKDKTVWVWKSMEKPYLAPGRDEHMGTVNAVGYSPDGLRIVSGSSDKKVRVWDASSEKEPLLVLEGHEKAVTTVAYSPDGSRIASGSEDYTVRVWDAIHGKKSLLTLEGHGAMIQSVAYSPDGSRIASGSEDYTVRVWDAIHGGEGLMVLKNRWPGVLAVAYSPDGERIVSGSYYDENLSNQLQVWDAIHGGEPLLTLEGESGGVCSVVYSPDGSRIVGACFKAVKVWDAVCGGEPLLTLEGHKKELKAVTYSPDGKYIASASWDKTVRVWDAICGGRSLITLKGHTDAVCAVAYSPDGKYIVSGSSDQSIRVWRVLNTQKSDHLENTLESYLVWRSNRVLEADGMNIEDAHLSIENHRLLKQLGATGESEFTFLSSIEEIVDRQRLRGFTEPDLSEDLSQNVSGEGCNCCTVS